ncbi:GNAT family N-acetyltransferase [Cytobacillus horneckiae]|uniref:N-acetyltransferase n=1 Tax=Cytobacillus horneckiae TaxID=549687 RepID=A0A2N0ZBZ7_9BACI|nr:GNAT family N-acetyltransferase [Cytobacillus horneckiae]MEC1155997.1 GNAT family N-acetyltransferase [Cytobacillus horneckiae]MED2939727.1 GNAT family N-acetyltransferase [Cytobacillus horneckiae]PKG27043.1 N-acetyltransferase [Cytobacillus horneckiae]
MINFLGTPKLDTKRLILRRFELKDVQSVFNHWISDERVTDNRINAAHKEVSETYERVAKIVKDYSSDDFCYWAIEMKDSNNLIGEIDLYNFDNNTGNCEVSYSLGYNWWNHGYGTEALKAVVEFGFGQMNVHKISAAHNIDNPASGKIMMKARMAQEGTVRHMIRNTKGKYKDCALYGILQKDYNESKSILKQEITVFVNKDKRE